MGILRDSEMEGKQKERTKNLDNSLELVKIQIYSDRAHQRLTTQITNMYAIFIGFVVFFYTLYYENVIPLFGFIIGLIIFLAGTVYQTYHVRQVFKRDVKKISGMIETVKEGKELPRLEDLVS
jgi:predicted histidine transporter YuiF (NhaC family)